VNDNALGALGESFLGVLPASTRGGLIESGRLVEMPAGKLIYDPELSIILDGTVRAFVADGSGRHLTVSYLRPSNSIGTSGVAGREFPLAFQSITESTVLRFPRGRFDEIRKTHPEVGWAAAKDLAHFLDDVLAEISRVAFQPIRARVAHHLLALVDGEDCVTSGIHQADLAAAVGSVREVVGRSLGTLRDAGLVEIGHSGITAINKAGLRLVAGQWG
jgi:CRP/FNR family cyclic AMP-dependent transcriptional regulator